MKSATDRINFRRGAFVLNWLPLLISGCVTLPMVGPDAARFTATAVSPVDGGALFAAAPGGKGVAFSFGGVRLASLPSGEPRTLSRETPLALAWSPDGGQLAAAFARNGDGRITVFGDDGAVLRGTDVTGRIAALFWPSPDLLLAVTLELTEYKFGTTCRESLVTWQMGETPRQTLLHETTLKPSTTRGVGQGLLTRVLSPLISPWGDELLYGHLMDPPAAPPYLKIMLRNITSGAEREIATTGFREGTAGFTADGDDLLVTDDAGRISSITPWSGAEQRVLPFTGKVLAVSPDGHHMLLDGRVLDNGVEVARFPPPTTGTFMKNGHLLVLHDGALFFVSGLGDPVPAPPAMAPEKRLRLRTLRAWRSSGLISTEEYVTAMERLKK